jgi:CRP/FNR family transcriptional regulator
VLDETNLAEVDSAKTHREYQKGQTVFRQGEPCSGIYCVSQGTLAIRKLDAEGNAIVVRLVHPGQTVGYRDFFAGEDHSTSADAVEAAQVCYLPSAALTRLLGHHPKLSLKFLETIATDLDQAETAILQHDTLPVRTRLAHLLLSMQERYGKRDGKGHITFSLPVSRQDIAAMLGTRPETIARTLNALSNDNVVVVNGRTVRIPNGEMLLAELEAV